MERAHKLNPKWLWNHIHWMNRCWDIWPGKYAKTTDQAESASVWNFFVKIQNAITQWGSLRSTWFMGHFESVFRALFSCRIYIVNKQESKNMFLRTFDFMVDPCTHNSCLGISLKYLIFRNAPKPIVDLYNISFLCTNFETFIIFSAIVLIDCTYPLD